MPTLLKARKSKLRKFALRRRLVAWQRRRVLDDEAMQLVKDSLRKVMAQREEILEAFIAKWGFSPEETLQVIQRNPDGEKFWVEKRVPEVTPELLDHAADLIQKYRDHVNLGQKDSTDTILRVAALSLRNRRIDASFSNSET